MAELEMPERDEDLIDESLAAGVRALRAERTRCPRVDRLLDYVAGHLGDADRREVEIHLAACSACAELAQRARGPVKEVGDLTWDRTARRLDQRAVPWAPRARRAGGRGLRLAVAAVVALAAVGIAWRVLWRAPTPPVSEVRGAGIQVVAPSGDLDGPAALAAFEWAPTLPSSVLYRVEVEAGGETVWQATTRETRLDAPAELRERIAGRDGVRWRVLGLSPSGAAVLESPWTALVVGGPAPESTGGEGGGAQQPGREGG
jgi:hypothetical protein